MEGGSRKLVICCWRAARRICAMRCMSRELHNEAINLASNVTKLGA